MITAAILAFLFIALPILAVLGGTDTWQSNRHNWTR
jgi:hypothetical protein